MANVARCCQKSDAAAIAYLARIGRLGVLVLKGVTVVVLVNKSKCGHSSLSTESSSSIGCDHLESKMNDILGK